MAVQSIEKKVYTWISEVADRFGADKVGTLFGEALVGAARTKASVDKNIAHVLALANIPSRGDYRLLQAKIDSLQGSVVNLTRKLDRLCVELTRGNSSAKSRSASKKSRTAKAKTSSKRASPSRSSRVRKRS